MGDIISFGQRSANVQYQHWDTVAELGRVGTLTVRIVASSDDPGQIHLVVVGGVGRFEVLASTNHASNYVEALRAIGQRVIRVLEIAEAEFSGEFYHPQME